MHQTVDRFAAVMGVLALRVTDIKAFLLEVILTVNIVVGPGLLLLVALIGLWRIVERTGLSVTAF